MMTLDREAPDNCPEATSAAVLSYAAVLDTLSASDLDSLASLIKDRADRQRVQIEYDEALELVESAWLSPAAERSEFAPIIQVKACLRRLIERGTYHPDQVRDAFLQVARDRAPHEMIAQAAINLAISEGLAARAETAARAEADQ